jgi:hypothetical protein
MLRYLPTKVTHKPGCSTIANRRLVETAIATVAEEAFSILRGYAVESGPERVFESLDGAGCDTAQV